MGQLEHPNLALLATRKATEGFSIFVTRVPCGHKIVGNYDMTTVFPIYRYPVGVADQLDLAGTAKQVNLSPTFLTMLAKTIASTDGLAPETIVHYAYAVFHSPGYRSRYSQFLKIDFPRLPLARQRDLFNTLASLGDELVALHVLESPTLNNAVTAYIGAACPEVEKVSYAKETVWLDKAQTIGFQGVHEAVWDFHIGGYQVCEKWLKDRKGRSLSKDDIIHYQKIVVALSETIRLMAEIDKVIEAHGGWPGAFITSTN